MQRPIKIDVTKRGW